MGKSNLFWNQRIVNLTAKPISGFSTCINVFESGAVYDPITRLRPRYQYVTALIAFSLWGNNGFMMPGANSLNWMDVGCHFLDLGATNFCLSILICFLRYDYLRYRCLVRAHCHWLVGSPLCTPLHLGHSYQSTEHVLFVAFFRTEVHEAQRIFIFQVMSNQ